MTPSDRAGLLLGVHDLEHVLEGERLEVEPVGGVVVGRDRLRVAVDHHGLVARRRAARTTRARRSSRTRCPARSGSGPLPRMMHLRLGRAARPRSPRRRTSSGTASARRTRPRRCRRSCRPAGCPSACRTPRTTSSGMPRSRRAGRRRSRAAWPGAAGRGRARARRATSARELVDQLRSGRGTTGRCRSPSCTSLDGGAGPQRLLHVAEPAVVRHARRAPASSVGVAVGRRRQPNAAPRCLQRAQRLLQRLGEAAADRHRLADLLHVRGQRRVGAGELLEREPRHLDHDVVEASARSDAGVSRVMSLGISSRV